MDGYYRMWLLMLCKTSRTAECLLQLAVASSCVQCAAARHRCKTLKNLLAGFCCSYRSTKCVHVSILCHTPQQRLDQRRLCRVWDLHHPVCGLAVCTHAAKLRRLVGVGPTADTAVADSCGATPRQHIQ